MVANDTVGLAMECDFCGGQLVWDYHRGEMVCTKCGLVVGVLTTLEVNEYRVPLSKNEKYGEVVAVSKIQRRSVVSSEYKRALKLYRECTRIVKGKPWLEVDYEKVFKTGRFVMSVKSKASMNALRNINILGYWSTLKKGLEFINSINPAFLARTERSKYALAYMIARKIETGNYPTCEEVTSVFNISSTSYKRLCALADKLIAYASRETVAYKTF